MWSIEWWCFQWTWMTLNQVSWSLTVREKSLRRCWKTVSDGAELRCAGRLFQRYGHSGDGMTYTVVDSILLCMYRKFCGGTMAAAPPPFRPSDPALCGSRPPVTPYYCRLGDLLCFVFMSDCCMFDLSVYCMYLQYFDTVGWVFWPVKTVYHITYTVLAGT